MDFLNREQKKEQGPVNNISKHHPPSSNMSSVTSFQLLRLIFNYFYQLPFMNVEL